MLRIRRLYIPLRELAVSFLEKKLVEHTAFEYVRHETEHRCREVRE